LGAALAFCRLRSEEFGLVLGHRKVYNAPVKLYFEKSGGYGGGPKFYQFDSIGGSGNNYCAKYAI
jgi:hypothetical protein